MFRHYHCLNKTPGCLKRKHIGLGMQGLQGSGDLEQIWGRFQELEHASIGPRFEFIDFNGLMLQPSRLHKSISYILPILHTCMQLSIFDASLTWLEVLYLGTIRELSAHLLHGMREIPINREGRYAFDCY